MGIYPKTYPHIFPCNWILNCVFFGIIQEILIIDLVAAMLRACITVHTEAIVRDLNDATRDIGAMVCHTFQIRQKIGKDEAELNRAITLLQAGDVIGSDLCLKNIDHFLQRLYTDRKLNIVVCKAADGVIQNLGNSIDHH